MPTDALIDFAFQLAKGIVILLGGSSSILLILFVIAVKIYKFEPRNT